MGARTAAHSQKLRHVVHFYGDPTEQVDTVVQFLADALADDRPVIAITELAGSAPFHDALARAGGVDEGADFELLDAVEVLRRIAPDGTPDPALFDAELGQRVRAAAARCVSGRPVLYGDMVGVLWRAGKVQSAIELEELWSALANDVGFDLCCGYPTSDDPDAVRAFATVCELHSDVLDAAPTPDGETSRRFPDDHVSASEARRYVAATLREWGLEAFVGDACLIVSELVSNAVRHARSDTAVALARVPDAVRIAVGDTDLHLPIPRHPDASVPGGRGLIVVAALARAWGWRTVDGGKVVWAELPLESDHSAHGSPR